MRRLCAVAVALLAILLVPAGAGAALSVTPSTVSVVDGTTVTFNATPDPGATLAWAFDDGSSAQGTSVSHTFTGVGQHLVTIVQTATTNQTDRSTFTVTVTAPDATPAPTVQWTSSPYPAALPTGPPPGFQLPIFSAGAKVRKMPADHAAIVASCMFATGACHGTVVLRSAKRVRDRPGHKARIVELGRKAFTLAPSTTATVAVTVPRRMRQLVAKLGRLGATAVVSVHDDAGATRNDAVKLTLTRAR
jgi:hypothetical protein